MSRYSTAAASSPSCRDTKQQVLNSAMLSGNERYDTICTTTSVGISRNEIVRKTKDKITGLKR